MLQNFVIRNFMNIKLRLFQWFSRIVYCNFAVLRLNMLKHSWSYSVYNIRVFFYHLRFRIANLRDDLFWIDIERVHFIVVSNYLFRGTLFLTLITVCLKYFFLKIRKVNARLDIPWILILMEVFWRK